MDFEIIKPDLELIRLLLDYFTARINNPTYYKEICNVAREYHTKMSKDIKAFKRVGYGYFDTNDFSWFITQTRRFGDGEKKIHVHYLDTLFSKLAELQILKKPGSNISNENVYTLNSDYLEEGLVKNNLLQNLLLGFSFVVDRYKNSVLKIEHIKDGKHNIGTGFLINDNQTVITNLHCVEKADTINLYKNDDKKIEIEGIIRSDQFDLAAIRLQIPLETEVFHINPNIKLISEILTIGYPSVPMTQEAYQLVHKGQINALVKNYQGHDFLIFSAQTSSGNSGSPVIDASGQVIGVITNAFFEETEFFQKGKLPYYAAIPSSSLIDFLSKI